uniref:Uncharacterized protein n=1 Tax=Catharus ustulatus TaxID=91951 RepID=A0A8C3U6P7_CATUS
CNHYNTTPIVVFHVETQVNFLKQRGFLKSVCLHKDYSKGQWGGKQDSRLYGGFAFVRCLSQGVLR